MIFFPFNFDYTAWKELNLDPIYRNSSCKLVLVIRYFAQAAFLLVHLSFTPFLLLN